MSFHNEVGVVAEGEILYLYPYLIRWVWYLEGKCNMSFFNQVGVVAGGEM